MKAIYIMFDSLNRNWLGPYGGKQIPTPHFDRLAQRSARFARSYACSLPCMPARRDFHTGRPGFLHREWGPLECFDDSMPEILRKAGVHTHLATDHYHYFEEGGQNYHTRYSTWEFFRGQEGDPWKPHLGPGFSVPPNRNRRPAAQERQDFVNRAAMPDVQSHAQQLTFDAGLEFLRRHAEVDRWFLHIETFDPHEPFFAPNDWRRRFCPDYLDQPVCDWPPYGHVDETGARADVAQFRAEYAALLAFCDHQLGRVLDTMDALNLWEDTMLIVGTDHGFLLGEHDYLAKNTVPLWEEIAHTPLFIWDPRCGAAGVTREALVQMIDLPPTLLEYFGEPIPADMLGRSLAATIREDRPVRQHAIFGYTNHYLNVTDGRHIYMRATQPEWAGTLWNYTTDPVLLRERYPLGLLLKGESGGPLSYSKGVRVPRFPSPPKNYPPMFRRHGDLLFDLVADPAQQHPLTDPAVIARLTHEARELMRRCDAPAEQFARLGWAP